MQPTGGEQAKSQGAALPPLDPAMARDCKSEIVEELNCHSCDIPGKAHDTFKPVSPGSTDSEVIGRDISESGSTQHISEKIEHETLREISPDVTGDDQTASSPHWSHLSKPVGCDTSFQRRCGPQFDTQGSNGRMPSNTSSGSCGSCCTRQSLKVHLTSGILNSKAEVELHGADATAIMARLMDRLTFRLGRDQIDTTAGHENNVFPPSDSKGTFNSQQRAPSLSLKNNYSFKPARSQSEQRQKTKAPPRVLFNVSQLSPLRDPTFPHSAVGSVVCNNLSSSALVERTCSSSSTTMSCAHEPLAAPAYLAPVFRRRNNIPSRPTPPINHLSPVSVIKQKPSNFGAMRSIPVEQLVHATSTPATQQWAIESKERRFSAQIKSLGSVQRLHGPAEYKPALQHSPSSEASTHAGSTERSFAYQLFASPPISPRHSIHETQSLRHETGLMQLERSKNVCTQSNGYVRENKRDETNILPTLSKANVWDVVTSNFSQEEQMLQDNRQPPIRCSPALTEGMSDFSSVTKALYGRSNTTSSDGTVLTGPHASYNEQAAEKSSSNTQWDPAAAASLKTVETRDGEQGTSSTSKVYSNAPKVPQLCKALPTQVYSDVAFVIPRMRDRLVPVITDSEVHVKVVDAAAAGTKPGRPASAAAEAPHTLPVTLARYKPYLVPVDVYIPKLVQVPLNLLQEETTTTPVMPIPMDSGNLRSPPQDTRGSELPSRGSKIARQQRLQQQLHERLNPHLLDLQKYNAQQHKHFRDLLHQAEQQAAACGVPVPTPTSTPVLNVDRLRPDDVTKTHSSRSTSVALDLGGYDAASIGRCFDKAYKSLGWQKSQGVWAMQSQKEHRRHNPGHDVA